MYLERLTESQFFVSMKWHKTMKYRNNTMIDKIKQNFHKDTQIVSDKLHDGKECIDEAVDAVDEYTQPREYTGGNFDDSSYIQASLSGVTEGLYIMGAPGLVVGTIPAMIGIAVENKTGSHKLGVAAGAASGLTIGAGIGFTMGGLPGAAAMGTTGTLLGTIQTMRGSSNAKTRDGAGVGRLISAPFIPGPAKLAGGIGAAVGSRMENKKAQALVGGAVAASIAAGLATFGFAPVTVPVAAGVSFAAGALGPVLGPRYNQLFRNVSSDVGDLIKEKTGQEERLEKEGGENVKNAIGSIPTTLAKEGITSFLLSDGDPAKMLTGGAVKTLQTAHVFLSTEKEKDSSENNKNQTEKA
jgi:hypothetical protein